MSSTHSNRSTPISRTTSTTTTTKTTTTTAYSYEHPDKESLAATKIQAGYRGYCTRKKYGNLSLNSSLPSSNYHLTSNRQSYTTHQSPLRNNNNNNDHNLENAATRIQASYRGYLTRKALRDNDDNITQKQYTPIKNVPYYPNDKTNIDHNIDHNIDDDDGKVKAVTKIQAGYRGYKTRKSLAPLLNHHHHHNNNNNNQHHLISNKENQNYLDYKSIHQERDNSNNNTHNLYDPELAATKIQATFRGYRTRRHLPK